MKEENKHKLHDKIWKVNFGKGRRKHGINQIRFGKKMLEEEE